MISSRKNMPSTTKVLHVDYSSNLGGIESYVLNVLKSINTQGYRFYFLNKNPGNIARQDTLEELGSTVLNPGLVSRKDSYLSHIVGLYTFFRKHAASFDYIEFHLMSYSPFEQVVLALLFTRARIIIHAHSDKRIPVGASVATRFADKIGSFLIKCLARRVIFVACSNDAGKEFFGNKKFTIIENGIDLNNFSYSEYSRAKVRNELNISPKDTVILSVARFNTQKNHTFILDAFNEYKKINKKAKLILVGEGALRVDSENKARKLGLAKSVLFLGLRTDTASLYSGADLMLMPSLFEGLPVSLIEAQATGLPCVVSDTISTDVNLTGRVVFVSLLSSIRAWSNAIEASVKKIDGRVNWGIYGTDYDIKKSVMKVERLYGKK